MRFTSMSCLHRYAGWYRACAVRHNRPDDAAREPGRWRSRSCLERRSCRASGKTGRSGTWSKFVPKPKRAVLWISGGAVDACLQTPVSEVHFAAQMIAQLVREKGLRYRDIAIITGDLSSYNNYVRKIFPQYHIPAFIDETRRILLNPCLEFVRGALEMCERDFACIPVFRFLRTQMAGITREQIDRLENYVLATGIRGRRRWEQDWDYRVGGISEEELEAREPGAPYRHGIAGRFSGTDGSAEPDTP